MMGIFDTILFILLWIFAIVYLVNRIKQKQKIKLKKIPDGKFDGRLIINTKDPNKDVFRLEYDGNIADISNKEFISFKVVREDL